MSKSHIYKFLVLHLMFAAAICLSLLYGGSERINLANDSGDFIFWQIRFPKMLTAILAGSTLSVSGLVLQIIFRNPLAGPYVLGISSGASLMVAAGMLAGSSFSFFSDFLIGKTFIVLCSVSGSFIVTLLILLVSKRVQSNVILLLVGLMFSQLCGAIQMSLEYFADPDGLKSFVIWGMGSLSNTTNADLRIYLPLSVIVILMTLFLVKPLNALLLGQSYAENLGINFYSSRFYLIFISSTLTGVTTAFCGPIAFVGISVPIVSRMIFLDSRQHVHFFSCILIGSILLLSADAVSNSMLAHTTLPINMLTSIIGAPLVIYLMFKNKQW